MALSYFRITLITEAIISHHAHQRPIQQLSGDDDWGPADDGDEALIVGDVFGFGNH